MCLGYHRGEPIAIATGARSILARTDGENRRFGFGYVHDRREFGAAFEGRSEKRIIGEIGCAQIVHTGQERNPR